MSLKDNLLKNNSFQFESGIFYQSGLERSGDFETTYFQLRKIEDRLYTDDIVRHLPEVESSHPLSREWALRKASLKNLTGYLSVRRQHLTILELGCGNGWLLRHLCFLNSEICGMDVIEAELQQGARLFGNQKHISFIFGDIFSADFRSQRFDVIVLASSIQYFPNLKLLIERLLFLLKPSGEILIIDTPLYNSVADANAAKKRSQDYFSALGFPAMDKLYFHHTMHDLRQFEHKVLYSPSSLGARIQRNFFGKNLPVFPFIKLQSV